MGSRGGWGLRGQMQRNVRPDLALHLSDLLSMTTPLGAGRGGGREEVTFWEEGTSLKAWRGCEQKLAPSPPLRRCGGPGSRLWSLGQLCC